MSHYQKFVIPESWRWVSIDEIADVVTGSTPSKDHKEYYGGDVPFYKPSDLEQGLFTSTASDWLTPKGYEQARKLPKDSVLVTCIGATIGKTGRIVTEGSCNQQINAVILHNDILSEYFYDVCLSDYFQSEIKNNASATTLPILNKNNFSSIEIPLPPRNEQKRILEEVNKLFSIIGNIESCESTIISSIDVAKSKILELAMQGKLVSQDPADEPAADMLRRVNPKARIITDNPHSRNIPEGWCVTTLSDLCVFLSRGKSPKYSDIPNQYPVFAQKCNLKEGGISLDQARFLDEATLDKWPVKYRLKTGDVLINSTGTGTVGRTRYFDECCLGAYPFTVPDSHVSVVRSFDEINSKYLFYCLYSPNIQQYFENNLAGSTNQKELYIDIIGSIPIILPPVSEQKRIVLKIEELYYILDKIEASLQS